MYVTTSKGASQKAKEFASKLASWLPFGMYFGRGKKGIEGVVEKARALGKKRACVVNEERGRLLLAFIRITHAGWEWMKPEVEVLGARGRGAEEKMQGIEVLGGMRDAWLEFLASERYEDEGAEVHAEKDAVVFKKGKVKFGMKVKYV